MIVIRQLPAAARDWSIEDAAGGGRGVHLVELARLVVDGQPLDPFKLERLILATDFPPIAVLHFDGLYYVHDGRHRAWLAWMRGETTISAEVTILSGSEK